MVGNFDRIEEIVSLRKDEQEFQTKENVWI